MGRRVWVRCLVEIHTRGCRPCLGQKTDIFRNMSQNIRPWLSIEEKKTTYGKRWTSLCQYPELLPQIDVECSRFVRHYSSSRYRIFILTTPDPHTTVEGKSRTPWSHRPSRALAAPRRFPGPDEPRP